MDDLDHPPNNEQDDEGRPNPSQGDLAETYESDGEMDLSQVARARAILNAAKKGRKAIAKELTREERQEIQRERAQRLTAVTRPVDVQDREFFLGYALIDVVNHHDGGKGPTLLPSPYRRPFSNKQLKILRASAGQDGSGLRTTDHEHALVVAAPSHFIDETQLSQTPYGPHRRVHWLLGALDETMVLLAGAHRQKTSQDLTNEHQKEILKIGAQADRAKSKGFAKKAEELEKMVEKMRKAMEPKVVWLAMIYDRDGILETRRQSGPALLKLITNNRVAPQPETEDHELARVFRLAHEGGASTTSQILNYISTLNSPRYDAYRRLAQRGGEFLSFVIATRISSHFDNFFTDSSKIVTVQTELWGLIGPTLKFMWNQLLYICCDLPALELDDPITEAVSQQLVSLIQQSTSGPFVSRPVLDTLVSLADASFNEHFSAEFIRIGIKNEHYYTSYCDYAQEILSKFGEAIRESQLREPGRWTPQDIDVALSAPSKVQVILLKPEALNIPGTPNLDNPTPLFSPFSAAMIVDDWSSCTNSVFMVSSWFMPGLTHIHTILTTGSVDKCPIRTLPGVIRLFLEYYLGFEVHDEWNTSAPADILEHIFDDGEEDVDVEMGKDIVETVFCVLLQLIWRYREPILRPSQRLFPPMPRGRVLPSRSPDDVSLVQHITTTAPDILKDWLKNLAQRTSTREKNVTPRLDPNIPDDIRLAINTYQQNAGDTRILDIYQTLECSVINFLVSPTGPTNNKTWYQQYMRAVTDEALFYHNEYIPTTTVVTPVAWLYSELVTVVTSFPSLENARFWLPGMPDAENAPKVIEDGRYVDLIVRNDRTEKVKHLNSAILSFVKRISRPNCLGVATAPSEFPSDTESVSSIDYRVHCGLRGALDALHRQGQVLAHHLAVLDNSRQPVRRPVLEDEWEGPTEDDEDSTPAPFHSALCTWDDLVVRYQDDQGNIERDGLGNDKVNEDALDPDFGRIPVGSLAESDDETDEGDEEEGEEQDERSSKRQRID